MKLSGHASQYSIYASTIALTALSCITVCLRLITRLAIVRRAGLDDAFISIAMLLSIVMAISISRQAHYGMGLHKNDLPPNGAQNSFEWFWHFLWLYYGSLCFTKLSILLQYLRIFPHPRFILACQGLMALIIVWSIWAVLGSIFTCLPVSKFWMDLSFDTSGCMPRLVVWYFNAAINISSDIATALLPLPIISRLELPSGQRNILMAVFGVGLFTCVISVLRLVYIYPLSTTSDLTWETPLPAIWSCVEVNTAILCSCVPTLKGLVQRFFPKLLKSLRSNPAPAEISAGFESAQKSLAKGKTTPRVTEYSYDEAGTRSSSRKSRLSSTFGLILDRERSDADPEEDVIELFSPPSTQQSQESGDYRLGPCEEEEEASKKGKVQVSVFPRDYSSDRTAGTPKAPAVRRSEVWE